MILDIILTKSCWDISDNDLQIGHKLPLNRWYPSQCLHLLWKHTPMIDHYNGYLSLYFRSFNIYPIGLDEQLTVYADVYCDCSCEENQVGPYYIHFVLHILSVLELNRHKKINVALSTQSPHLNQCNSFHYCYNTSFVFFLTSTFYNWSMLIINQR